MPGPFGAPAFISQQKAKDRFIVGMGRMVVTPLPDFQIPVQFTAKTGPALLSNRSLRDLREGFERYAAWQA